MVVVVVGRDPLVVIEVVVAERQCSVLLHLFSKTLCETFSAITALSCTSFAATERLNEVREEGKQKKRGGISMEFRASTLYARMHGYDTLVT